MSGICKTHAPSPARISEVISVSPVAWFAWSPGGIRGRRGEVLSCRDPRSGGEVEASDAIESELPLAFRSAVPESIIEMFSRVSRSNLASLQGRICAKCPVNSYYSTVTPKARPKTVFSGIQPTGIPHVG